MVYHKTSQMVLLNEFYNRARSMLDCLMRIVVSGYLNLLESVRVFVFENGVRHCWKRIRCVFMPNGCGAEIRPKLR